MPSATAQLYLALGGINVNGTFRRSAPGQISQQLTPDVLVAGFAGALTTRTDNDTGVVTLENAQHGLLQNDKVSVCWAGGSRLKMNVSNVAGAAVTVDLGTGENLPAQATAVVVAKLLTIDTDLDGDLLQMVGAVCDNDLAVGFYTAADALLLQLKLKGGDPQGEPWFWAKDSGVANPLTGNPVSYVLVGNGEATPGTFNLAALYDSV